MSRGGRRKHAQGTNDGTTQMATRYAVVTATGRDALTAAEAFAAAPDPDTIHELFVQYFTWRLACRKLIGALRHAERSGVDGLPPSRDVRQDERAVLWDIADVALPELDALHKAKGTDPRAAAAARELAGDLTSERRSGAALRLGTLRRTPADGWTIEPHAPGLHPVGIPHAAKADLEAGAVVVYEVAKDGTPDAIEALAADDGRRRRRARPARP